jgi:hypothetical protein
LVLRIQPAKRCGAVRLAHRREERFAIARKQAIVLDLGPQARASR